MKPLFSHHLILLALFAFTLSAKLHAQPPRWQPTPGHTQIPIWPGKPPGASATANPPGETLTVNSADKDRIAGRPWEEVDNVTQPTMTVYAPRGKNTGAAVVIFPGGGYKILAIDLEGTEVCDWFTARGITCILLKYRVPDSGPAWDKKAQRRIVPKGPFALQDAQRTLRLVRHNAAAWHIDPHKIGVLGFSAGGHIVAETSTHFDRPSYPPVDAVDRESCRPDFAVAVYPGHLYVDDSQFDLNPDVTVTPKTPPTFLLQAENDNVDGVNQSLAYYVALKKSNVPTEMHLYAEGGHAFGLRRTKLPITNWPQLVETWLQTIGIIPG